MAELIALGGEWTVLRACKVEYPFALSFIANIFSWIVGGWVFGYLDSIPLS
jgi:hypothetical protein